MFIFNHCTVLTTVKYLYSILGEIFLGFSVILLELLGVLYKSYVLAGNRRYSISVVVLR